MHYWTSYCALQAMGVMLPNFHCLHQWKSQDLEGTITCPIVHWQAFFILFYHFKKKEEFILKITHELYVFGHIHMQ